MAEARLSADRPVDERELEFVADPALHLDAGGNANLRPCWFRGEAFLLKEFHEHHLADISVVALNNLIEWRRGLSAAERDRLDGFAAWPQAPVWRAGRLCGVLIPLAPAPFYRPRRAGGRTPRTAYDLMAVPARAGAPLTQRLRTFGRAIEAVLWLHEHGVVVSDLQPANILCDDTGQAVWFVDCDSMISPRHWGMVAPVAAPESMKDVVADADVPVPATDLAKLAWVLMRVLLDDFALTVLGATERERLEQRVGPDAMRVLQAAAFGRDPAPRDWQLLAADWRELTVRIPTAPATPRAEATAPTAPRAEATAPTAPTVPVARSVRPGRGSWLPPGFSYRPGPAPQVFPPDHLAPGQSRSRLRTAMSVLLIVATGLGLIGILTVVATELFSGRT